MHSPREHSYQGWLGNSITTPKLDFFQVPLNRPLQALFEQNNWFCNLRRVEPLIDGLVFLGFFSSSVRGGKISSLDPEPVSCFTISANSRTVTLPPVPTLKTSPAALGLFRASVTALR